MNKTLKSRFLQLIKQSFPHLFKYIKKNFEKHNRIINACLKQTSNTVVFGPFAGMHYDDTVRQYYGFSICKKMLGTYESDLHPVIRKIIDRKPTTIINIGSAEGYYSVGFALSLPKTIVHSFDNYLPAQISLASLAKTNNVDNRIFIHGHCSIDELKKYITNNTVVICDCEGCEFDILKIDEIPSLSNVILLVETHDHLILKTTATLIERFSDSHNIETIQYSKHSVKDYEHLETIKLSSQKKNLMIDEERVYNGDPVPQKWLYCVPIN